MGADSTVLALKFLETENGRQKFTSRMHGFANNRLAQKSVDYHSASASRREKVMRMCKSSARCLQRLIKRRGNIAA